MTSLNPVSYSPIAKNQAVYNELYALYRLLHDAFDPQRFGGNLLQPFLALLRRKSAGCR
jgi:hypothetical protein